MSKKCLVLLSGGLDSTTTLAIAKSMGFSPWALTFNYGQRNVAEVERAKKVAAHFAVERHQIVRFDLSWIGGSALTDDIEVPAGSLDLPPEIPITYVPARNTIFLSCALGFAEVHQIADIFIGVNAIDYSGYPDCRPEYIRAFEALANLATKAAVEGKLKFTLHTPLLHLTKAQIIQKGLSLGVDYDLTLSCYNPTADGSACGICQSCLLREKGFIESKREG